MITSRQMEILRLIVDDFITTGLPVGSRTISKNPRIKFSPATIRNDMADLEEVGLIIQPHISAGRIPSELGIRYYIDTFVEEETKKKSVDSRVRSLLSDNEKKEDITERAVRMLSNLSDMTAIISMPAFRKRKLHNLKLISLTDTRLLMVLVSDNGETRMIELKSHDATQRELDELSEALLEKFKGESIESINIKSFMPVKKRFPELAGLMDYVLPMLKKALKDLDEEKFFICGKEKLLQEMSIKSMDEARNLLSLIEDETFLKNLLDFEGDSIDIRLGSEFQDELLQGLALLRTHYHHGSQEGCIALLGPIRMDYTKNIQLLSNFRETLGSLFTGIKL